MADILLEPVEKLLESLQDNDGEILLCRCCGTAITHNGEKIEIGISHCYRFTNPAGVSYAISCFRNAAGCDIVGPPTIEDSWFGGYQWQLATCCDCQEQLGWYYQNNQQRYFFGLIQNRLTTTPP